MTLKNTIVILLLLGWLNSCHKTCHTILLNGIMLNNYDPLTDSSALIVRYDNGTNFSTKIDSSSQAITSTPTPGVPAVGSISCDFSNTSIDYIIVIHPSGKVYKISDIRYGTEKENSGCGGGSATMCSYGYTLNGNAVFHGSYQEDGNAPTYTSIIVN